MNIKSKDEDGGDERSCVGNVPAGRRPARRESFPVCQRATNFPGLAQFIVPKVSNRGRGRKAGAVVNRLFCAAFEVAGGLASPKLIRNWRN
jgi:hypothetical protein